MIFSACFLVMESGRGTPKIQYLSCFVADGHGYAQARFKYRKYTSNDAWYRVHDLKRLSAVLCNDHWYSYRWAISLSHCLHQTPTTGIMVVILNYMPRSWLLVVAVVPMLLLLWLI